MSFAKKVFGVGIYFLGLWEDGLHLPETCLRGKLIKNNNINRIDLSIFTSRMYYF